MLVKLENIIKLKLYGRKRFFFLAIFGFTLLSVIFLFSKVEGDDLSETSVGIKTTQHKTLTASIEEYNFADQFVFQEEGKSSWYGRRFHNRKTASGERYDMFGFTAAHRSLPFGTIVRITNPISGKKILVKINDRGPFIKDRIIDLSYSSAEVIDIHGVSDIKLEALMFHETSLLRFTDEEFLFGYSVDLPLVCLPISAVKAIYKTDDFEEALDMYSQALVSFPDKPVYLMVPANKDNSEISDKEMYIITYFEPKENDNKFAARTEK